MECPECKSLMERKALPIDVSVVHLDRCRDCDYAFVVQAHALLGVSGWEGEPSTSFCPACQTCFLDLLDLQTSAGSPHHGCRQCGGLRLLTNQDLLSHGLSLEGSGLAQFLTALGLVLRDEQRKLKAAQLPASFQVEKTRNTALKCPNCDHALMTYLVQDPKQAGGEFEICDHCFGIWLDRSDYRFGEKTNKSLNVDFESIEPSERACPKCRDLNLFAMRFKEVPTVIDCCPSCFGTWLDGGELGEFCQYLNDHDYDVIDILVTNAAFQTPGLCKMLRNYSRALFKLDEKVEEQERNLEQARVIQTRLLFGNQEATNFSDWLFPPYKIAGFWQPAQQVGGDYFDVLPMTHEGSRHLLLCIADVSGKGLAAALLMSNFQALLRSFVGTPSLLAECCERLNAILYQNTTRNKYITAFIGLLNLETGVFSYVNAGHNPPGVIDGDQVTWLKSGDTVLGLLPEWKYKAQELVISPGQKLLLYTDGASEACSPEGEEMGEERLVQSLRTDPPKPIKDALNVLVHDMRQWCQGRFDDDATLLLIGPA